MSSPSDNIPCPPGYPVLGNLLAMNDDVLIRPLEKFADEHGSIFRLRFLGRQMLVVADHELVEEMCDEKRFWKAAGEALSALSKEGETRFGLFVAPSEEHNDWQQAHRILIPAFGPLPIQNMYPEMHDIASQLVLKWARLGPSYKIPVTLDFTRLTLDTIALCSMDHRFNSFYQEEMNPFVEAMNVLLTATNDRLKPRGVLQRMMPWDKTVERVEVAREFMGSIAKQLIQHRRTNPTGKRDLLNAMIHGKDPKTGKAMDDELIVAEMVTFLVAGHETTSGLLSFAILGLLQNPETYAKAQEEVDRVVGGVKLTAEHLKHLPYLNAVLRETLRLYPTAPGFVRAVRPDSPNEYEYLAGGKYPIKKGENVLCLLGKAQQDPKIYGPDAKEFRPDRMLDEEFSKLPQGSWQPFGTGKRACIGRSFAWQEGLAVMALIFQNFDLKMDDPTYKLKVKQTLTIKPDEFYMRATLRDGITPVILQTLLAGAPDAAAATRKTIQRTDSGLVTDLKPMSIYFGSNTGTCQSLAQKLSVEARRYGYNASVKDMDGATDKLDKEVPAVIITASYEGQPPDNAGKFVTWLETQKDQSVLQGVRYAVFGCGNSDWATTFQRVPTHVDESMESLGAERIASRGSTDAAKGDIYSDFDAWTEGTFWPTLASPDQELDTASTVLEVRMWTQDRSEALRQDVKLGKVVAASTLTAKGEPEKRHLEVKLPEGMSYQTGDYLAILPLNPPENVRRIMRCFGIATDAVISIKSGAATFLPTGTLIAVKTLLEGFVDLSLPATRKDLAACVQAAKDAKEKAALQSLSDPESFTKNITAKRVSLLDLLERYHSINLGFNAFLSRLPPLRPRHYSISSSPLKDATTCTVTYAIIDGPALSENGRYIGITSAYLAGLRAGDDILMSVRSTNKFFHLPQDSETTPIMLFCGGSGIAPFRGFIEERALQLKMGHKLAPAILFVGCRSSTLDRLYALEIDAWAAAGAIDVRYAFSRESEKSQGCRYVQDRMRKDKEDVLRLWRAGAKVFTCGSPALSEGVGNAAKEILIETLEEQGKNLSSEEADDWFRQRRNERFVVDVFA